MASLIFADTVSAPKPPPTIRRASSFTQLLKRGSNGFADCVLRNNDFVTVVKVQETHKETMKRESDEFVTVLEVGDEFGNNHKQISSPSLPLIEEITVYRLPGERLGMALKFEGGGNSGETVNRVLIQNINCESPASKIHGKLLGRLKEGDEILKIDGKLVSTMTRLECVAALRDASVCFKLLIKRTQTNSNGLKSSEPQKNGTASCSEGTPMSKKRAPPPVPPRLATTTLSTAKTNGEAVNGVEAAKRRPSQPPPLPPRKPKESQQQQQQSQSVNGSENAKNTKNEFNDELHSKQTNRDNQIEELNIECDENLQNEKNCIECVPIVPIQATYFLDSLSEKETTLLESESDDTGSSVSTIIERFSRGSTANSSFSDGINGVKGGVVDIKCVLSPFEKLERELDEKEAMQKYVSETAAFIENHGGPSSMAYDVNLDDYDDIENVTNHFETVTSHFEMQNFNEPIGPIVEPPVGFANTRIESSKTNGMNATNGWQQSFAGKSQLEKKGDQRMDCFSVFAMKANQSQINGNNCVSKSSQEENVNSPSVTNEAKKSHENQKCVKLLSSIASTEEKDRKLDINSKNADMQSNERNDQLNTVTLEPRKQSNGNAFAIKSILKNKQANDANNAANHSQHTNDTLAASSVCNDQINLSNVIQLSEQNWSTAMNEGCNGDIEPGISNEIVDLIQQSINGYVMTEEKVLISNDTTLVHCLTTKTTNFCQQSKKIDADFNNIDIVEESSVSFSDCVSIDEKTGNFDKIEDVKELSEWNTADSVFDASEQKIAANADKDLIDSRVIDTKIDQRNDDFAAVDKVVNDTEDTKCRLKKAPKPVPQRGGLYSLIPKRLESSRIAAPPVSPRKSKSQLNLLESDHFVDAKPSLIPRAVVKPLCRTNANNDELKSSKLRKAKSSENLKGFAFREICAKSKLKSKECEKNDCTANEGSAAIHQNDSDFETRKTMETYRMQRVAESSQIANECVKDSNDMHTHSPQTLCDSSITTEEAIIGVSSAVQQSAEQLEAVHLPCDVIVDSNGTENAAINMMSNDVNDGENEPCEQRPCNTCNGLNGSVEPQFEAINSCDERQQLSLLSTDDGHCSETETAATEKCSTTECLIKTDAELSLRDLHSNGCEKDVTLSQFSRDNDSIEYDSNDVKLRTMQVDEHDLAIAAVPETSTSDVNDVMSVSSSRTERQLTSPSSLSAYIPNQNSANYYSGHLQPSYRKYTTYDPLITSNAIGVSFNNESTAIHSPQSSISSNASNSSSTASTTAVIPSAFQTRKQNLSKLKGLVIPEQPATVEKPAVSKTLPTIISSTTSSTDLLLSKPEEVGKLVVARKESNGAQSKSWTTPTIETSTVLSEPPWMSARSTVPKYSPAFKRRALELPRSLSSHSSGSSGSSTSAVASPTTPLSPTPFVTTSYSSNKVDGLFQFSLSHSKPIVPLVPETAYSRPTQPKLEPIATSKFISNSLFDLRSKHETCDSPLSMKSSKNNSSFCLNDDRKEDTKMSVNLNKIDVNGSPSQSAFDECNSDESSFKKRSETGSTSGETMLASNSSLFERNEHEDYKSSILSPDNSDDESSLLSHKASDASSNKADDSAYETLSDSFERTLSPEIRRPKELSLQRTVLKNFSPTSDHRVESSSEVRNMDSVKNFKALAEKWEQRVNKATAEQTRLTSQNRKVGVAPPLPPKPKEFNRIPPSLQPRNNKIVNETQQESFAIKKVDKEEKEQKEDKEHHPSVKQVLEPKKRIDKCLWESKDSKERAEKVESANANSDETVPTVHKIDNVVNTLNTNSVPSKANSAPVPPVPRDRSMSVSDICKVFEVLTCLQNTSTANLPMNVLEDTGDVASPVNAPSAEVKEELFSENEKNEKITDKMHYRMSSLDSTTSDSGTQSGLFESASMIGSRTSSVSNLRDSQYGSITSLASTTSLISPQELQHLIEEANQSLEGEFSGHNAHNIQVIVLHREYLTSGSIGITLAGGVDYETKEITVHKVISGSVADRDGRVKKGDRILSINGKILKGLTHREALNILKAPRPEVVLVLSRSNGSDVYSSRCNSVDLSEEGSRIHEFKYSRSRSEDLLTCSALDTLDSNTTADNYKIYRAVLIKDGAGLGFILEGGKDSPLGDRPLAIKRVFKGGPADKEGTLIAGDELVSVNEQPVHQMTRTEAWNHLKKLPDGSVAIVVRRRLFTSYA